MFFSSLDILFDRIVKMLIEVFAEIAELKKVMLVKNVDFSSCGRLIYGSAYSLFFNVLVSFFGTDCLLFDWANNIIFKYTTE